MEARLAAGIHDAKNSLASLATWLAEAHKQAPSPALEEAVRIAARLTTQLLDLLVLHRAQEGSLTPSIADHDLGYFCADVLAELELPPDHGLEIVFDPAATAALGSWAFDAYLVKLALLDALRNGARHARHRLRLVARIEHGVVFEISDDGPGYPDEVLAGQPVAALHRDPGHSGLGLGLSRLIAAAHSTPDGRHGTLELRNENGARFRLYLP